MSRGRILSGAVVAIAISAAGVAAWHHWSRARLDQRQLRQRPEVAGLVRAAGTYRPLESRLTGGFQYGSVPVANRTTTGVRLTPASPDVRIAIARVEQKAATTASDADWAAMGTAYLLAGELDRGVEFLEAAVATPSPNPLWLSDLSAGYLEVAKSRGRSELVPKALATAERACRLDSQLPEAAFNRALALEAIHLTEQAERSWTLYRSIDPTSPWGQEALTHLARLEQERADQRVRLDAVEAAFNAGLEGPNIDLERLRSARYRMRGWIETRLIPVWAEQELAGDADAARDSLRRARAAAELLVRAGGDPMPRDAIRAIDESGNRGDAPLARRRLARAHVALRQVLKLYDTGSIVEVDRIFESVRGDFADGRSPYLHWSPIYRAMALYSARRFTEARRELLAGRTADTDGRYRYLAGRRDWLIGLIDGNEGRLTASLAAYQTANQNFQAVGESDGAARVMALLAETLARLGANGEAWRYELAALSQVEDSASSRLGQLLQLGGILCLNSSQPEAALYFQNALIGPSGRTTRESSLTEAYIRRARINERLSDSPAARSDLEQARSYMARIPDESLKRREAAEIASAEAEILVTSSPADAVTSATQAIAFFRDSGGETVIPGLHVRRALARAAERRFDLAEEDLSAAIQHFETQRRALSTRQFRASFFQDGARAFAEMARVEIALGRSPAAALDYAERGRARTLLEAATNSEAAQPASAASVQAWLPGNTCALFFVTLEDRLLIWVVQRHEIRFVERPIALSALRSSVDRVRWLLRSSAGNARLQAALKDLYAELIEPVIPSGTETIVIVPDGPLHGLPFSGLMNPKTGRYLVQDAIVTIAPSLSMMISAQQARRNVSTAKLRALIVGNPSRESSADEAWLPPLPFSEDEAVHVAAVYADSTLLTGSAATKRALLEGLRNRDVVHYAGHALVDDDSPALSRLLLAPDSATGDDGSLLVTDLAGVSLGHTRLVVLAACSTGTGLITNGEGVQSLARPFLEAGAESVVATFWDIQDATAGEFFLDFHRRVAAGVPPATALAEVQRRFIESADPSHRRPSQWAWAVIVGTIQTSSIS